MRPSAKVMASDSAFIHAIISTSPVSAHWAIAGTRPSALYRTSASSAAAGEMTRPDGPSAGWSCAEVSFAPGVTESTVPSCPVALETVSLETLDGVTLEADVIWADTESGTARAFVVIGHPHPAYGGDRHNHVVRALQWAAHRAGCHSITPDFRGAGGSLGEHDNGDAERLDLAAACEFVAMAEDDMPVVMAGYSFGSVVAMNVSNPAIAGWLAVAPPVGMMANRPTAANSHRPKHLLLPRHDQFTTAEALRAATADWTATAVTVLESVDHFIAAGAEEACAAALDALLTEVL